MADERDRRGAITGRCHLVNRLLAEPLVATWGCMGVDYRRSAFCMRTRTSPAMLQNQNQIQTTQRRKLVVWAFQFRLQMSTLHTRTFGESCEHSEAAEQEGRSAFSYYYCAHSARTPLHIPCTRLACAVSVSEPPRNGKTSCLVDW